jgi:hypothetical protein
MHAAAFLPPVMARITPMGGEKCCRRSGGVGPPHLYFVTGDMVAHRPHPKPEPVELPMRPPGHGIATPVELVTGVPRACWVGANDSRAPVEESLGARAVAGA